MKQGTRIKGARGQMGDSTYYELWQNGSNFIIWAGDSIKSTSGNEEFMRNEFYRLTGQ